MAAYTKLSRVVLLIYVAALTLLGQTNGEAAMTKAGLKACLAHMGTLSPQMKENALR